MVDKYGENSEYIVEEMESTSDDYKLIKKSFEDTIRNCTVETHKIYRVKERDSDEKSKRKSDNMLLFHGTNRKNAVGILEKGFKPSSWGLYGPGVYLTASPNTAHNYSVWKTSQHKVKSSGLPFVEKQIVLLSIFVNEILQSNKLKVRNNRNYKQKSTQFARYVNGNTKKAKKDSDETYEKDSNGRKIKTSRANERDDWNHYVCHENVVIPRYLIEFY